MRLMAQAAQALAALLADALPELAAPPVAITAPTSLPTQYPALAVMLDTFTVRPHGDDTVGLTEANLPTIGADAVFGTAQGLELAPSATLVTVGTVRGRGRIWLAARTAPQREALSERVLAAFFGDDATPGCVRADVRDVRVAGFALPFTWPVVYALRELSWTDEFTFSERQWAWLPFDVDLAILVARQAPRVNELLLQLTAAPNPDTAPSETVAVQLDGTFTDP